MLTKHHNINDVYAGRLAGQAKAKPYLKIFRFRNLNDPERWDRLH
jgi:hypothetical protein